MFHGNNKFLEMRLNLSEEDFEEMMQKVQKESESSLDELSLHSDNEENVGGFVEDFDIKGVFMEFSRRLMENQGITDLQYYYLKCLFLENNKVFMQIIYPSLE